MREIKAGDRVVFCDHYGGHTYISWGVVNMSNGIGEVYVDEGLLGEEDVIPIEQVAHTLKELGEKQGLDPSLFGIG